jgi:hypothetical protein
MRRSWIASWSQRVRLSAGVALEMPLETSGDEDAFRTLTTSFVTAHDVPAVHDLQLFDQLSLTKALARRLQAQDASGVRVRAGALVPVGRLRLITELGGADDMETTNARAGFFVTPEAILRLPTGGNSQWA